MTKIAFIGFGEAAQAFTKTLRDNFITQVSAFDTFETTKIRVAAESLNVTLHETPQTAVDGADWIISAVTAGQSLIAAQSFMTASGQVFFDINSVSPQRKIETSAHVKAQGADYVDMAVMTPVHPKGHRSSVLIAGDTAGVEKRLRDLDFNFEVISTTPGDATAIKMVRSLFVKGLEALTVQTLLAADSAGCFDRVAKSLENSYPGLNWPDFAAYQIERVGTHGKRRAEEMRESAVTMENLGHHTGEALASATADLQDRIGALGLRLDANAPLEMLVREIQKGLK